MSIVTNVSLTPNAHRLRAALSGVRHLEEAARFLGARLRQVGEIAAEDRDQWRNEAMERIERAARALDGGEGRQAAQSPRGKAAPPEIQSLWEESRKHGPLIEKWKSRLEHLPKPLTQSPDTIALLEDARFFWWSFHRLMKLLSPQDDAAIQ